MDRSCSYNVDTGIISNNIIVKNYEINNIKNVGMCIAFSVLMGANLLSIPSNSDTNYCYSRPFYELFDSKSTRNDIYTAGMIVDLLQVENVNKINRMKGFEKNWNGNGADKFSAESINLFLEVINSLCKQPQIAPTGNGSLLLQYEMENKSILAFDVAVGRVEKVFVPEGRFDNAETDVFTNDICDRINKCVEEFYGIRQN